jgi:hypothetical protein
LRSEYGKKSEPSLFFLQRLYLIGDESLAVGRKGVNKVGDCALHTGNSTAELSVMREPKGIEKNNAVKLETG